eukprot:3643547-Alexandrium_andersonii.AAC.1
MKLRGKKKDQVEEDFASVRKSVVESLKESSTADASEYKCMTIERYKELHNGKHPTDDGHQTTHRFHKGKICECVLIALQNEGEWKVTVADKEALTGLCALCAASVAQPSFRVARGGLSQESREEVGPRVFEAMGD